MVPEGHGFGGFCPRVKKLSQLGVVDVIVMDTTDKPVLTQYPYEHMSKKRRSHWAQNRVRKSFDFSRHKYKIMSCIPNIAHLTFRYEIMLLAHFD